MANEITPVSPTIAGNQACLVLKRFADRPNYEEHGC